MTATLPTSSAEGTGGDRARMLVIGGLVLVVMTWAAVALRHHQRDDEWRHGGDQVKVHAAITATDSAGFGAALEAAGGSSDDAIFDALQGFVVTADWAGTPKSGGTYQFVLLDARVAPAQPVRASAAWADGEGTGPNGAGAYDELHEHYSWLAGMAQTRLPDGSYTGDTDALGVPAKSTGSATLAYWFDNDANPTTDPARDFRLAMFFVDSDGEVRWARKIPLAPAR
jgi:hypothetical protein